MLATHRIGSAALALVLLTAPLITDPVHAADRALREMQIHKFAELGLEIWVRWPSADLAAARLPDLQPHLPR